jgi:hypothetical protein
LDGPEYALMRRAATAAGLVVAAMLCVAAVATSARADERANSSYTGGLKLVWGSLPLPQFGPGLTTGSNTGYGAVSDAPSGSSYSLTLSAPGDVQQQFLFSPRMPQLLPDSSAAIGTNRRSYLGFSIDVGEQTTGLFGTLGLGGSVPTNRQTSFEDTAGPRALNAPLLLHGGFELGYRADSQSTFTLSLDRALPAEGPERNDTVSGVRLRYGLKF